MYSMNSVIDNVLHIWKLLRECIFKVFITHKMYINSLHTIAFIKQCDKDVISRRNLESVFWGALCTWWGREKSISAYKWDSQGTLRVTFQSRLTNVWGPPRMRWHWGGFDLLQSVIGESSLTVFLYLHIEAIVKSCYGSRLDFSRVCSFFALPPSYHFFHPGYCCLLLKRPPDSSPCL